MFFVRFKIKSKNIHNITVISYGEGVKIFNGIWNNITSTYQFKFFLIMTQVNSKLVIIRYTNNANQYEYKMIQITGKNRKNKHDFNLHELHSFADIEPNMFDSKYEQIYIHERLLTYC
jgi:hypothetical protein